MYAHAQHQSQHKRLEGKVKYLMSCAVFASRQGTKTNVSVELTAKQVLYPNWNRNFLEMNTIKGVHLQR